jgi:hypothetical protein
MAEENEKNGVNTAEQTEAITDYGVTGRAVKNGLLSIDDTNEGNIDIVTVGFATLVVKMSL